MLSWLSWFIDDLFYWIAVIALVGGAIAYVLSNFIGYIPMLKAHATILKVVGLLLVILGGYYVANQNGYNRRVAEDKAEIERLNGEARAKEAELNGKLAKANGQLKKAKDDIKNKVTSINDRIDSGELRIPAAGCLQADSNAPASAGNTTDGTESNRSALKAIVQIAADGDNAITSLNACITNYKTVMEAVNGGVK